MNLLSGLMERKHSTVCTGYMEFSQGEFLSVSSEYL